jgi:hypothetical protein
MTTTLHRPLVNPGNFCHITSMFQFLAALDSETIQQHFEAPLAHAVEHVKGNIDNQPLVFEIADALAQYSNGLQGDPNDNLRFLYSKKLIKDSIKLFDKKVEEHEALIIDITGGIDCITTAINAALGSAMILRLFGLKYLWCEIPRNNTHKIRETVLLNFEIFAKNLNCGSSHFRLQSVIVHKGSSALGGHYVCCVFHESQNKWFVYDDNNEPRPIDAEDDHQFNTTKYFGGDTTISTDATMVLYKLC